MKKKILVVGGAGYIGSHAVKLLTQKDYIPIILDDFSSGHIEAVNNAEVIEGDLGDLNLLEDIFTSHEIFCVMHFAAFISVGDSEKDPLAYYENNVSKTRNLLSAMLANNVKRFVFSSSAAVYGTPSEVPIREDAALSPINPYGNTKYIIELLLADLAKCCGLKYASLRYFNASGADPEGETGEAHDPETHLIPLVLDAASGSREFISIFGTDYDTPDGSCVRDYIHVSDLVEAHILAIENLDLKSPLILNLGNGNGFSVKEIIDIAGKVTGKDIPVKEEPRRPGDPASLVADASLAYEQLKWQPQYNDIHKIIESAWNWHQKLHS